MAMHNEQVLSRHEVNLEQLDWKVLLASDATTFRLWNGLGGAETAAAFIKYAQACAHYKAPSRQQEEDAKRGRR
jgi:hypothetical protein